VFLTLGAAGAALATLEPKASTKGLGKDASVRITYMPVRHPPLSLPGPALVPCKPIHIAGRNVTHKGRQHGTCVSSLHDCRQCVLCLLQQEPASVATTSGAGDCLVAGAAAALLRGLPPPQALAHGMVCPEVA